MQPVQVKDENFIHYRDHLCALATSTELKKLIDKQHLEFTGEEADYRWLNTKDWRIMPLNVRPGIAFYNHCTIVDVSYVTADLSTTTRLLVLANLSPSYLECWDMRVIYFHAYNTIMDYGSNIHVILSSAVACRKACRTLDLSVRNLSTLTWQNGRLHLKD